MVSKLEFLLRHEHMFSPAQCKGIRLTIFLFNNDHIDGSAQRRWIDRVPCLRYGTADTSDVLHSPTKVPGGNQS